MPRTLGLQIITDRSKSHWLAWRTKIKINKQKRERKNMWGEPVQGNTSTA